MPEHDDPDVGERSWIARLGRDFDVRLLTGIALAAAVAVVTFSGPMPFSVMVVLISLAVSWEWGRLVNGPDAATLLVVQLASVAFSGLLATFLSVALGLLALAIGAILATLLSPGRGGFLSALGVLYAGFPALAMIWLRSDHDLGLVAVIFLIVCVVAADTAAFVSGRLLRGPLLWPEVSPNKTWAGFAGAVLASAIVGACFWAAVPGGSMPRLAAAGALLAVIAQAGDLFESGLKRRFGAKDAGSILPGHGGIMDRVDGLVAAAAAVALAAMIFVQSPARALLLGL